MWLMWGFSFIWDICNTYWRPQTYLRRFMLARFSVIFCFSKLLLPSIRFFFTLKPIWSVADFWSCRKKNPQWGPKEIKKYDFFYWTSFVDESKASSSSQDFKGSPFLTVTCWICFFPQLDDSSKNPTTAGWADAWNGEQPVKIRFDCCQCSEQTIFYQKSTAANVKLSVQPFVCAPSSIIISLSEM